MTRSLRALVTPRELAGLAGEPSFSRGEEYAAEGRVSSLVEDPKADAIAAAVRGTARYRVRLWATDGQLRWACTCPMAEGGAFCKHCVAAALVWASRDEDLPGRRTSARRGASLRALLRDASKEELERALLDVMQEDPELDERLRLRLARDRSDGRDLLTLHRRAIARALGSGPVDHREASDFAARVSERIRALEDLLRAGRAAEVRELAEHFIGVLERRVEDVDDSDGRVGESLRWLGELHVRACRSARAEPVALARWLLAGQLRSDYGTFGDAVDAYADVLGPEGIAEYERLADEAWARVRALGPGEKADERSGRFRITEVTKALARRAGDVERLVAVLQRDLSSEWGFLEIAKAYRAAGRHDAALEWAERGRAAFPTRTLNPLREFLVEEYERRGRTGDAAALLWQAFVESPSAATYRELAEHAPRGDWPAVRAKALMTLRKSVEDARRSGRPRHSWEPVPDRSQLVAVFLWEGDVVTALREAREGGCSNELWRALAERLERDSPEEALPIYEELVDPAIRPMHPESYEEGAALVRRIRDLYRRLGRGDEFGAYLARVRASHGRKRNFMRLLTGM